MASKVENINTEILRQSREQIGLSLDVVSKKVSKIGEIEEGTQKPTFKQLDTLANLYKVPRWVFISKSLPEEYQFDKAIPAFRQLADSNIDVFNDHTVRSLTAKVDRLRKFMIELLEDMGEAIPDFIPPRINSRRATPEHVANQIRDWLGVPHDSLDFAGWKGLLEKSGIFIFMTSKYKGWSHVDKAVFRGMTIYHDKLPIIIINDSDAKKAQSFSLFHELGHILRKESTIDDWEYYDDTIEDWCDALAGNILMPADQISAVGPINDLDDIKKIAKPFQVSAYACLVRLRQMQIIDQNSYELFESQLKAEYRELQKQLKERDSGPARNRSKEILNQYGRIYLTTVFQAYHNQEINFHKLCRLLELKKPSHVLDLEASL